MDIIGIIEGYKEIIRRNGFSLTEKDYANGLAFLQEHITGIDYILDDPNDIFKLFEETLRAKDINSFKTLLGDGENINLLNSNFETFFTKEYSGFYKELLFVKAMHSKGADFDRKNKLGENFFSIVLRQKDTYPVFEFLSSLPEFDLQLSQTFGNGNMHPSHLNNMTLFHIAILEGKLKEAALILNRGFNVSAVYTYNTLKGGSITQNALHLACMEANPNMVDFLLNSGLDPNDKNSLDKSSVYLTIQKPDYMPNERQAVDARLKILDFLKSANADIDMMCLGITPLYFACSQKYSANNGRTFYSAMAERLIKLDADLDFVSDNGHSLLHLACQNGDFELFAACVKAGVNIEDKNNDGDTPLLCACKCRNNADKIIMALLRAGANANITDNKGQSAMEILSAAGNASMVEYLISLNG